MSSHVTILVVEDQKSVRDAICAHLQDTGATIVAAGDGIEALKTVMQKLPDMVVADINMPGLDGLKFCQALRTRPGGKETEVIFLTATQDPRQIAAGVNLGAKHFLTKPVSKADLLKKLEPALTRAKRGAPKGPPT